MEIGDKILHEESGHEGEIVHMDDARFRGKIACTNDVCVLWNNGQKITYDKDFMSNFKVLIVDIPPQKGGEG